MQAVISDLYKAQATTDADLSTVFWDHAAAKYLGPDITDANTDRSQTIYARADKRAANYGTLDSEGKFALANKAVIDELKAASTIPSRKTAYTNIVTQIKVIYAQCVLRYAYLIDANLGNYVEYQAEGQAFWKILAPWVNDVDENGAIYLEGIFDTARPPTHGDHFCHAKEIIAKLNLPATDFGTLEGTAGRLHRPHRARGCHRLPRHGGDAGVRGSRDAPRRHLRRARVRRRRAPARLSARARRPHRGEGSRYYYPDSIPRTNSFFRAQSIAAAPRGRHGRGGASVYIKGHLATL